jgi:glutamate-1-semialdehyde 2,1-aminomutase
MSFPVYTHEKSREWFTRAAKVIPAGVYGHLGPAEGLFIPVEKWPLFSERAEGTYFWDVDGNKYIDYMCAYGPNILGYNDPDIDAAAAAQAKLGDCVTSPGKVMVECAEMLVDTVASADWCFFAKNGNDTTQTAAVTARAFTRRKKIIFFKGYYHGVSPWQAKKDYGGVLEEEVMHNIILPWDDIPMLERTVEENKDNVAAIIAQPYDHGNFHDNVVMTKEFWAKVRKICDDNGIQLIIDDVRAGFRLDIAGSDHYFGFKADMICFCKALANGYNMSALMGRDHLKSTISGLPITGSYWMSSVPFAACIATINKLKAINAPQMFDTLGTKLINGLIVAGKESGFDLVASGKPSLFYLRIANDNSLFLHQEWVAECVSRGVFFTSHHNHFINAALTDEDINHTLEVAADAFKAVKNNHPELS